ncbi:BIR protein [Plasmodium berghei]|uniref:BIR protein n=2 Tax=Plasmodium berghei TaxID=5821 RepID=A0A509ATA8_PLABA|nr:BIR protein [Plasmodium berghei ANKA]CXI39006.1 BIR protein [Plasmodium berghei]SBW38206.1 BIR protein [Plasmodium berghei]SCL82874.1 BIR protein [Plasmodium berghei]SCL83720.1 BIR protein [Plasmodium berghei]VUC58056.1 BIR protein [Plasmodium berghei ANKA]|eukprot:XP_034423821.1 BIR protein [Plasmodium berghei ANKA]
MDKNLCSNFIYVTTNLEYDSNNKNYKLKDDQHFKKYCDNENCGSDLERVNAGCLYFFNEFFGSSELFKSVAKSNINIVDYIMLWLNYMLSLKENQAKNSLNYFYTTFINNERYTNSINDVTEYNSYKDLINKRHKLTNKDMDNNIISELYDAFKLLCEMYSAFDGITSNCTKCSEKADEFIKKYNKLNKDSNNIDGSSYRQILCTLSSDYDSLKNKCKDYKPLPEITENISAQMSEVKSSSSLIGNKLFTVLLILGAIAFFLGISYKYSLFGFRKRAQKQYLREKLKK